MFIVCLACCSLLGGCVAPRKALIIAPAAVATDGPSAPEPTRESCDSAVSASRTLAATLPASDMSRKFAESYLMQALVEAGNGEFDDCLEFARRATVEVREHRHGQRPGAARAPLTRE